MWSLATRKHMSKQDIVESGKFRGKRVGIDVECSMHGHVLGGFLEGMDAGTGEVLPKRMMKVVVLREIHEVMTELVYIYYKNTPVLIQELSMLEGMGEVLERA